VVNAGLTLTLLSPGTIENVVGGALSDTLTGNALNNFLAGGAGNDTIEGLGGNDTLTGGSGNDSYRFDTDNALGSDTVNESGGYVVHHLTAAFNSGDEGTDFQRFIEFSGKRLTLKPPPTKDGSGNPVQTSLVWERLSD